MLWVGYQEGHPVSKKLSWYITCGDLTSIVYRYLRILVGTATSSISCCNKFQNGLTLMVVASPGCLEILIIIISGLHHYECVVSLVANSFQSGRFWARSTASVHDSPWESRSFCTVVIQVICSHTGGLFQYTEAEEVKICFASTLSSIRVICPNRVRRHGHARIISVSRVGWSGVELHRWR